MTNRERILKLLNRDSARQGALVWRFGLLVRMLPALPEHCPKNIRAMAIFSSTVIWGLVFTCKASSLLPNTTRESPSTKPVSDNTITRVMSTPLGDLTEIQEYLPTSFSTGYVKHFVATPA